MRRKSNTVSGKKLFHVLACPSRRCGIDNDLRRHSSSVLVRCCSYTSRACTVCGPTGRVAAPPGGPQPLTPHHAGTPAPITPSGLLSYKSTLWSPLQGQAQNTATLGRSKVLRHRRGPSPPPDASCRGALRTCHTRSPSARGVSLQASMTAPCPEHTDTRCANALCGDVPEGA
jgi:hypothetical protein